MRFVGHSSQGLCDSGFTEGAKDADDAISQRGHNPGRMVRSDGGMVFTKGDVTDIVEAVFNAPMASIQLKNPGRVSLVWGKAGNAIGSFFGCFLGFEMGKFSVDTKDLSNKGECQIVV